MRNPLHGGSATGLTTAFKADVLQAVRGPEELPVLTMACQECRHWPGDAACWLAELGFQVVLQIIARSLLLLFLMLSLV
jgi:hypothetical protein